eukprot:Gregarina_sp_Pseudo_9__2885@NODE_3107_length_750_cov_887_687764_g2833_i0_p1_GENE_NODE_3107_length_750_cov_887_687764_g2833_i0NODE_3107_length_750_cov_887_687764_g2833_i0_p1_ORF_typecomplete_len149_score29_45C2/PF00168_30/1_6e07_NODE_3107_length_750_cov_887_687764_g2833_i092538
MESCFEISIENASGVSPGSLFASADHYIVVKFDCAGRNKYFQAKTRTIKNGGTDPVFRETLTIQSHDYQRVFLVQLWSERWFRGVGKDSLLGEGSVVVDDKMYAAGNFTAAVPLTLGDRPAGTVFLSVNLCGSPLLGGEDIRPFLSCY